MYCNKCGIIKHVVIFAFLHNAVQRTREDEQSLLIVRFYIVCRIVVNRLLELMIGVRG